MFGFQLSKIEGFFSKRYKIGNYILPFEIKTFNPKKYRDHAEYTYKTAYFSWMNYGASDSLMQQLAYLETSEAAWLTEVKSLWLIYVSCLLQRGNKTEALRVLQKYHYCFGTINIPYFLPAANLAYENGISNKQIELANSLFLHFEQQQKENSFEEKILNAKRIAIVGNAPNLLGKNKGKEIDSHDIVIRINNFKLRGFETDTGSKVDIWSKNLFNVCIKNDISLDPKPLFLICNNHWNTPFQIHLFAPKTIADYPLYFSPIETYKKINAVISPALPFPSTGYFTVLWIYSLLNSFDKVDLYGFSFLDDQMTLYGYYYKPNDMKNLIIKPKNNHRITMHNFEQECINLKKLYNK